MSSLARDEGHSRRTRLAAALRAAHVDVLIVSDPVSIHYLSGFARGAHSLLLIGADAASTLISVEGFRSEASAVSPGVNVELVPTGIWARALTLVSAELAPGAPVGFEAEQLTHAQYVDLADGLAGVGCELVPADSVLARLRAVKSGAEIAVMRTASGLLADTFEWFARQGALGRTEQELSWMVEVHLRSTLGADALAFPSVVASGPNAAVAHHTAGQRQVRPGEFLVLDIGCVVDGYRADATRTFSTGHLPARSHALYELVLEAQLGALAAVRAGAVTGAVHAAAVDVFARDGLQDRFYHGVGHGVGLDMHELPWVEADDCEVLQAGEVLTVEPGLYLPGELGVRIEDQVAVTADGFEQLQAASKELTVLR